MNQPVKTSVDEKPETARKQHQKLFALRDDEGARFPLDLVTIRANSLEDARSGDPLRCVWSDVVDDELFRQLMAGLEPGECREIEAIRADRIEWKTKAAVAAEAAPRQRVPVGM